MESQPPPPGSTVGRYTVSHDAGAARARDPTGWRLDGSSGDPPRWRPIDLVAPDVFLRLRAASLREEEWERQVDPPSGLVDRVRFVVTDVRGDAAFDCPLLDPAAVAAVTATASTAA
eukprot:gene43764-33756_t